MRSVLTMHDIFGYVDGSIAKTTDNEVEWTTKDSKALSLIILSVSASKLTTVMESKTSKAAWDALKEIYVSTGPMRQAYLYKKLYRMRKDGSQSMQQYLTEFSLTNSQLVESGVTIPDDLLKIMLMESLPREYESFVAAITARDAFPTMKVLKTKLLEKEAQLSNKSSDQLQTALFSTNKKKGSQDKPSRFNGTCNYCHRTGHKEKDCRDKEKASKQRKDSKDQPRKKDHADAWMAYHVDDTPTDDWCLDSGASRHYSTRKENFDELKEASIPVYTAADNPIYSEGVGNVTLLFPAEPGEQNEVHLRDVTFMPTFKSNLLSVGKITDQDSSVHFYKYHAVVRRPNGSVALTAQRKNGLYFVASQKVSSSEPRAEANLATSQVWHQRYGHLNFQDLRKLNNNDMVKGLVISTVIKHISCEPCLLGKIAQLPYSISRFRADNKLDLVHSDLCGPMRIPSMGGSRYLITFTDDFSRYCEVYFLKTKDETFEIFKRYKAMVENLQERKIKELKSDGGGEYISNEFGDYLDEHGIFHDVTPPRTPQLNGRAERPNRSLVEMARTMLIDCELPVTLWAEAIKTAVYIRNRSPSKPIGDVTPFELWFGRKPAVGHFRRFGCKAVALIKEGTSHKFAPKGRTLALVGYCPKSEAYRLWVKGTTQIKISRDVRFIENENCTDETATQPETVETTWLPVEFTNSTQTVIRNPTAQDPQQDPVPNNDEPPPPAVKKRGRPPKQPDDPGKQRETEPVRRSSRLIQKKQCSCEDSTCTNFAGAVTTPDPPKTVKQALASPDADKWKEAMDAEMQNLRSHEAWELVERPADQPIIGSKWVFSIKQTESGTKYKARLVAQGFSKRPGIDFGDTYSPVIRKSTIRLIFAIAAEYGWAVHQLDINAAYLHSKINRDIYMEQPQGYENGGKNIVCYLLKSIYGLPSSGKDWNEHLRKILIELGFTQSKWDPCVYQGFNVIIGLYVDDKLIAGLIVHIQTVKKMISERLNAKDIGRADLFLGIEVNYYPDGSIGLHQATYIEKVLEQFGFQNCKGYTTPMNLGDAATTDEGDYNPDDYRRAIGSFLYLATSTRPDLCYVSSYLSQFNDKSTYREWVKVKHVLRYLRKTSHYELRYRPRGEYTTFFTDADYAADPDRKSYSGFVAICAGGAVTWHTRKQQVVSTSTQQAEYIAMGEAAREVTFLKGLMRELQIDLIRHPTIIHADNQAAIKLSENRMVTDRSKHIDVQYHFVRDLVERGEIVWQYVPTDENIADFMTKAFSGPKTISFCKAMGLF